MQTRINATVFLLIFAAKAFAQEFELANDITKAVIDGNALGEVRGRAAANVAAGNMNTQSNAAAIALNVQGASVAWVGVLQDRKADLGDAPSQAIARITGRPFADASGLITINQASGHGNGQANAVAIAVGIEGEAIADSDLEATRSDSGTPAETGTVRKGLREASIGKDAFEDTRGIVQVNQSAGLGNVTVNNVALRVSADARL